MENSTEGDLGVVVKNSVGRLNNYSKLMLKIGQIVMQVHANANPAHNN